MFSRKLIAKEVKHILVQHGYWMALPYSKIHNHLALKISLVGVVPQ